MHFALKTVTHEELKDSKGRLIPTVICEWISEGAKEEIRAQRTADQDHILALIDADPKASLATLATKMGWKLHNGEPNKMKASRMIDDLERHKLIMVTRAGNYRLTDKGQKETKGVET
jgi:hypothetical protein